MTCTDAMRWCFRKWSKAVSSHSMACHERARPRGRRSCHVLSGQAVCCPPATVCPSAGFPAPCAAGGPHDTRKRLGFRRISPILTAGPRIAFSRAVPPTFSSLSSGVITGGSLSPSRRLRRVRQGCPPESPVVRELGVVSPWRGSFGRRAQSESPALRSSRCAARLTVRRESSRLAARLPPALRVPREDASTGRQGERCA
jgi:hypothetical protein